jgi:hypothetical protein
MTVLDQTQADHVVRTRGCSIEEAGVAVAVYKKGDRPPDFGVEDGSGDVQIQSKRDSE